MDSEFKATGGVSKGFLERLAIKREIWERRKAERIAREKAEWDALPEDEKQRITAERERERLEMENQQREEKKRQLEMEQEELLAGWQKRGITPRFYGTTWENWMAETPERKSVLEKVKQAWSKNLFITGKNGTGKTHLAMCLAKDGAVYCLVPELFRAVRDDQRIEQQAIDKYGKCKLLILDEAGRQKGTDFERNLLFEIIDKRWNNMLPTTIMGNIDKKDFANLYGSAVIDRLRPEIVELNWESNRDIKGARQ